MDKELRELIDGQKIRDALSRYARGVDRRDWDLVAGAYHVDGYDDHISYKGDIPGLIEWLRRRHAHFDQSMHFNGNCLIEFKSDTVAIVETYCVVYQRYDARAAETIKAWLGEQELPAGKVIMCEMACRYIDRFEKRDGEWRIARRKVLAGETKAPAETLLLKVNVDGVSRRDRQDPLYEMLAED